MQAHKLWDFVRPCTEIGVWRVVEIDAQKNRLTAEKRPSRLGESCKRVKSSPDFFISLEEEDVG
ncbi:hypothetical protein QUA82_09845 [Microcoleus sp. F8-D3]